MPATVQSATRAEGTAIREIPPPSADTAGAAGRPGAADRLIAGERTVGHDHGGIGHVDAEAEDATAGGRTAAREVCDGTAPGARGVPRARLPVRVELHNGQVIEIVDAAALPGAKIGYAVTAGFTDCRVAAERAARDGHGRTGTLEELLSAPPPALAPGLPPSAWLPVNVLSLIVAEPLATKERSMRTAQRDDVAGRVAGSPGTVLGPVAMALLASKVQSLTVSAPDEVSSMPPPNPAASRTTDGPRCR